MAKESEMLYFLICLPLILIFLPSITIRTVKYISRYDSQNKCLCVEHNCSEMFACPHFHFVPRFCLFSNIINCIYTGGFEIPNFYSSGFHTHTHTHTHVFITTCIFLLVAIGTTNLLGRGILTIVQQMKRNTEATLEKL
jgi:hypothetical protein